MPEDLEAIEKKMKELAAQDLVYEHQMWPRQEAIDFFTKRGEPLKVQLIEEKTAGQTEVSVYTIKDRETFVDFCLGPHVPSTEPARRASSSSSTSNAYWKGDAKGTPMQRVYGTAFFSDKDLQAHLDADRGSEEARPPEARARARTSFTFHPVAPGAAFWTPRGTTLYNTLVAFCQARQKAAFQEIKTPLLYNKALWEQSGHWGKYRENMFLVLNSETNEHDMGLKPMNCPSHHLYYGDVAPLVPRAAASAGHLRRAAPERGVGVAVGTHARAAVRPGRLPRLPARGSDRRGSEVPDGLHPRALRRASGSRRA